MKSCSPSPLRRWAPSLLAAAICLGDPASSAESRVFHSSDGRPLTASVDSLTGDTATLRRSDGKTFDIPLSQLSAEDQAYLRDYAAAAGNAAKKLNDAAGHPIADGTPFSQVKAEDLSSRLKLRPESQTKFGNSWRLYAAFAKGYQLFNAMPYSVALYSDENGYASSMSIVFANKGDFGSTAGFGQEHFGGGTSTSAGSLTEAMARDEDAISKALTTALGEGKTERFGEGKTRRKITRWDWNGHSFLLANEENEYVGLSIVPTAFADAGGRTGLTRFAEVKKRLLESVVKEDNGDIYISEIPMVDQGPKGYCVPATFERAMRTLGLEADMYLLAMVGQSQAGGGTSVELMLENVRRLVTSKGRRIKDESIDELRIRNLKRYLDAGVPVMWRLCSVPEYNEAADKNTADRATETDWKNRADKLTTTYASMVKRPKPESNYHMCMIVGYNETTQELAVSDSWGARFERRWVPLSVANWASNGGIFMILP